MLGGRPRPLTRAEGESLLFRKQWGRDVQQIVARDVHAPESFGLTHVTFYCVKLWLPLFNSFLASARRKLWLKKKSARTRRVRVRNRRTASTAARRVKAPATQSSSIVIAATKVVREISELTPEGAAHMAQTSVCVFKRRTTD